MGVTKIRRKARIAGPLTVVGSADFAGRTTVNGLFNVSSTAAFGGTTTFSGMITMAASVGLTGYQTVDAQVRVNTPMLAPAGSASTQFAGYTRLTSGAASVVVSTTAVKSNSLIMMGVPHLKGALVAGGQTSGAIAGGLCVSSISQGKTFVVAWMGGLGYGENVDIPWQIVDQA